MPGIYCLTANRLGMELSLYVAKMQRHKLHPLQIEAFTRNLKSLVDQKEAYLLPESAIEPVEMLPSTADLPSITNPHTALPYIKKTVVIKLNGGLGTSMGLPRAKGCLAVKDHLTFIDLVAHQIMVLRRQIKAAVPVIFMNSYHTSKDTLRILERYRELDCGLPLEIIQSKVPKVDRTTLQPAEYPPDRTLEWCPPGHGDLYLTLKVSGMLDNLLAQGYRYAFVSNIDNTGATLDLTILTWFAENDFPFLMEVTARTEMDRKGGHLAKSPDGKLILREVAQCPPKDLERFQDIKRHRFFNTNNLWLNLEALNDELHAREGILPLPLIVNRKPINPQDPSSAPVYQLETAMGAAINVIPGATALEVPRSRFAPVKTTNDLLLVRSDAYVLDDKYRLHLSPQLKSPPIIDLDPQYYKMLYDFEMRFPQGPPSLVACRSFKVKGDITFPAGVIVRGAVELTTY